jgi:hypothetical protein
MAVIGAIVMGAGGGSLLAAIPREWRRIVVSAVVWIKPISSLRSWVIMVQYRPANLTT